MSTCHRFMQRPWAARAACAAVLASAATLTSPGTAAQPPAAIASAESSAPGAALAPAELVAALRRGGWVAYFRHTATDFSKNDAGMKGYGDCENQRLLSPQGRRDATQIGRRIRALGLAGGEVLASPYCRTMDHAWRMLGQVTPRAEIREAGEGDYAGLKALLATPVPPGRNRWIVGHGTPFRTVAGPPHLAEGEAAVIQPRTTGWAVVARIRVEDWATLAGP